MKRPAGGQRVTRWQTHALLFALSLALLLASHLPLLSLPFHWDELGQFIPAALDLYREGAWIPRSTLPNSHPPGVMAYLALVWHAVGYSIVATRVAMLVVAAAGVWLTFLVAVRLSRGATGLPALWPPLLLLASPLFFTQSMMALLDMPAMVATLAALLLFWQGRLAACVAVCVVLVLLKETSVLVPLLLGLWLARERRWRQAAWFLLPVLAVAAWLLLLAIATGHALGNREYAVYNLLYPLHPVRLTVALVRRIHTLALADFLWIGSLAAWWGWRRGARGGQASEWQLTGLLILSHALFVSVVGGAALERYLLPVIPLVFVGISVGWSGLPLRARRIVPLAVLAGLVLGWVWNPPYPFPWENNLAVVDFVRLQQAAAEYLERQPAGTRIASVWPFTDAARRPEFGYVRRPLLVAMQSDDFREAQVGVWDAALLDAVVVYSRMWQAPWTPIPEGWQDWFLNRVYGYEPPVTPEWIQQHWGMTPLATWQRGGQWITVYGRARASSGTGIR